MFLGSVCVEICWFRLIGEVESSVWVAKAGP